MINENLKILVEIMNVIIKENAIFSLTENLKALLLQHFQVTSLKIYIYDSESATMRDCIEGWSIIDENSNANKEFSLYDFMQSIQNNDFIINNKAYKLPTVISDINIKLKDIYMPVLKSDTVIGLIKLTFQDEMLINYERLLLLKLLSAQLSLKFQNIILNEQSKINVEFHDSMKNIAKIIETQYELSYIVPIIGEMLDRFISDHLIYVFLKQNEKFNLVWPKACNDKRILEALENLSTDVDSFLTHNNKIGVFPLISDNMVSGCIVARSTLDVLSKRDISYLEQLTKQASVTINRANSYAKILQYATLDALTNLNNRRQFEIRLNQEIAVARRQKKPLCGMMIDIDFFKKVNDTYGHSSGDEVLRTVASIISAQLRESDIASRYGGEEFAILLPFTTLEEAQSVAERLRQTVESTDIFLNETKINVTISMGVAQFDLSESSEQLFENADKALYDAKNSGRNKVITYQN